MDTPLPQVLHALGGEHVIVPLPRKLGLDEAFRGQALHRLDDLEVGHVEVFVFGCIEVFLGDEDALCSPFVSRLVSEVTRRRMGKTNP